MIQKTGNKGIILFVFLLITAPGVLFGNDNQQVLEVYLKEEIISFFGELNISDIIETPSSQELAKLNIKNIIPVNEERIVILPLRTIRAEIQKKYTGPIILVGKRVTVIPGKIVPSDKEWFYSAFAKSLENQFSDETVLISVEFISLPDKIPLNSAVTKFKIQKQSMSKGIPTGLCSIIWNTESGIHNSSGIFDAVIHAYTRVIVPKYKIKAGEIVTFENSETKEVDLAEFSGDLLFAEDFFPMKARMDLPEGEPVLKKQVTKNIIVRAGERINITFQRKNLVVSMAGKALSSGSFDEEIRVRPDGSVKSFQGYVSGEKEVRIEFR